MKKIITLLALGFISHFVTAQSITNFSSVSPIVCNGGSTTCLVQTNASQSATITYSLELDNGSGFGMYFGFPQNSNNQLTINNLQSGSYRIIIQNAQGVYLDTLNYFLTQPASLNVVNQTPQMVSCLNGSDGSYSISVMGGTVPYTFSWSNGQVTSSNQTSVLSNLSAGSYTCNITDANGCSYGSNPINFTITQPSTSISLSSSSTSTTCNGDSDGTAIVNASGGTPSYTFLWSDGQTTQTATTLSAGTYTCIVTDINGCSSSASVSVTEPPIINANLSSTNNVSCNGGSDGTASVNVQGGVAPYTYLWMPTGQTTQTAINLNAGSYNCFVTDANGCNYSNNPIIAIITEPNSPLSISNSSSTAVTCFGGADGTATVLMTGGTQPYSYSWSNGQTTQTANTLSAGTYTCIITDANGCFETTSILVTQPTAPISVTTNSTPVSCNSGSDGTAEVFVSGGTSPYVYNWSNGATTQLITGLSAGTYSCDVFDVNGCVYSGNSISITVTEPNQPISLNSVQNTPVSCHGGTDGTATVNFSGGTPPYIYTWSNGQTTNTISNVSAGVYTLDITDANNCTHPSSPALSVTITQPLSPLSYTTDSTSTTCNGDSDGTATVLATGGTPPYSYLWSNGQTTQTATNLIAGFYNFTITDSNLCVETSANPIEVTEPLTPLILTSNSTSVSCNSGNNGTASVLANGGIPPYTYLWSNGNTNSVITGLSAATYQVTVTDNNNCSSVENVSVDQPNPINNSFIAVDPSCYNGSNGLITANPTGGTPPYSYQWNDGQTTQTASSLVSGTYIVTVIDSFNCAPVNFSQIISDPSPITAIPSISNVSCTGGVDGSISLSVSGGYNPYTYLWSNTQTTQTSSGLNEGTYSVVITDDTSCSVTLSYNVTQPNDSLVTILNITDVSCYGASDGSAVAMPTGGTPPYNYTWFNGQNSQSINYLSSNSYTCTVTDANGCISYGTGTVNQPSPISLSSSVTSASCNGFQDGSATIIPQGGTSPYTYYWSNGQTTQTTTNLFAGQYSVMVQDSLNCSISDTLLVSEPNMISINVSTIDVVCNGDSTGSASANASGTFNPFTYIYSDGTQQQLNLGMTAGSYSIEVFDASGCSNISYFNINEPSSIVANLTPTPVSVSGGSDGSITTIVTGGNSPYTYSWAGPNNYSSTNASINGLLAGTYTLTVTDNTNCTQFFQTVVSQPNCNLLIDSNYISPQCYGDLGILSWNITNGVSPYSNTLLDSDSNLIISGMFNTPNQNLQLSPGVYDLVVEDNVGCQTILNIPVVAPDSISVALTTTDVSCFGSADGIASAIISGGVSPYQINWGPGNTNPNTLIAGNYNVMVTDDNQCVTILNYSINQPSQIVVDSINTSLISCNPGNDGTATIYTSGGTLPYSYQWTNGQTTQTAINLTSGSYIATVFDNNGCSTTTLPIQITAAPVLSSTITVSEINCTGGADGSLTSNVVGGTSPYSYNWYNLSNPNVVISNNSSITNLSNGAYSLLTIDANGCIDQDNIVLTNPAPITFTLVPTNISSNGANNGVINVTNISGGQAPYSYIWTGPNGFISSSTQNPVPPLTNLMSGQYTLGVTDANGCNSSMSTSINEPACNVSVNETVVQPICFGLGGSLNWTISGGVPAYTSTLTDLSSNQILYYNNTPSNLSIAEGFYSLKVEDLYGCSQIVNISITAPNALTANVSITDASCFGYSDGSVVVIPSGGTTPYNYSYNGENPNALSAGIYTLSVSDANGCNTLPSPITYQIQQPTDINVTYSTTSVSCNNGGDGTATVSVTGGTFPYTYLWSPSGLNTPSISNLSAGNQYISVTDANGCVPSGGPTQVYISEPVNSVICNISPTAVSCNGDNDGQATAYGFGGTPPYTYLWSNGQTSQTATSLVAGTYNCAVADANGCTTVQSTTITEPSEIFPNLVTTDVTCNGLSDGTAMVNPSGGSGVYNVIWPNGSTNYGIQNLQPGVHFVSISDNTGCSPKNNPTTYIINEPNVITLQTSVVSEPFCNLSSEGEVSVAVTGGTPTYSYSWEDVNGSLISQYSTANNISQGTYIVFVTDVNGCSASDTILLGSPSPIVANVSVDSVSCPGGSDGIAMVNPTGGTSPYSYSWSGGNGSTTNTMSGLDANSTYYVSIIDANGCSELPTIVTVPEPDQVILTDSIISADCFGGGGGELYITSTTGGTAPYTYSWSNGNTGLLDTNLIAGSYIITTTDNNQCIFDQTFIIGQPSNLIVETFINLPITCNGGSDGSVYANATGGTIPYTYSWNSTNPINNTNIPNLFNLSSGTYYVSVTDNNGCVANSNITLDNPLEVSIDFDTSDFNGYNISCFGNNDGSIWVNASGGTGSEYTYSWNFGSVNDTVSSLSVGTYTVTVSDSVSCSTTESITLSEPAILNLTTSSIASSCYDSLDGSANVSVLGGVLPYSYIWNNGQLDSVASNLSSGSYNVTVTDINGCSDNASVYVSQPSVISSTITVNTDYNGYDVQCSDSSNAVLTVVTVGGNGNQYIYSTEPLFTNPTPLNVFNNVSAGIFTLYTKDMNGCISMDSISITSPDPLLPSIIPTNVTCSGGNDGELFSLTQGGVAPYSYLWSNGLINNSLNQNLAEGIYWLEVVDDNGCEISDTIILGSDFLLESSISTTLVSCSGTASGTATIDSVWGGTPNYTFLWSNSSTTPNIGGLVADTLFVIITDANGCNITEEVIIEEAPNVLTFDSVAVTNLLCNNDSSGTISLFAAGGVAPYSYSLLDSSNNLISTDMVSYMLDAGTYIVSVTDSVSCTYSSNVVVSEPLEINSNYTYSDISCFGYSDGYISTNVIGGTYPFTYVWTGPDNFTSILDSVGSLGSGSYVLSISDINECLSYDTIVIEEPIPLTFGVEYTSPSCNNYSDGTISIGVTGGNSPYNASFNNNIPSLIVNDSLFFTNLSSASDILQVSDENGCISQINISLSNPLLLEIKSTELVHPTCYGYSDATASVEAMGGISPYDYFVFDENNNPIGNTSTITNLSDGEYSFMIVDANGCEVNLNFVILLRDEIEITENTKIDVECFGDNTGSIYVDVDYTIGEYQIFWSTVASDSVYISDLFAGIYQATVIDENNCIKVDSFEIVQNEELVADLSTVNASCAKIADGIIYIDNLQGGIPPYNIYMNTQLVSENEFVSTILNGISANRNTPAYNIDVIDDLGCVRSEQVIVEFDGGYGCIDEPVIISPNADGINDNWQPVLDIDTDIEVSILNRWGILEYYYSGNSTSFEWNGSSTDGYLLPSSDYYYIIKFNNINYPDRTGAITLIR